MIGRTWRTLAAAVVAAGLLLAPLGAVPDVVPAGIPLPELGPGPVRAATPDLTLVADTRYVVQPDKARVHIVVDLTATNHKADSTTRRFYFESGYLAVLPGTTHFSVTAEGATPAVRVRSKTRTFTVLAISFGRKLYSGQSQRLRLQFDLPDPGGAASREVRIGPSLATFPVWAFASEATPGGSVTIVFPPGYAVHVESGDLPPPTTSTNGSIVYRTGTLARPLDFYAYLSADRPASLVTSTVRATVGSMPVELTLRRWVEDPAWAERTGDLFQRGLPVLGAAIGLPFPGGASLAVEESTSRTIGGYAGLFDPQARTVQVAYYADPFVVLHEAGHIWFNGSLLADRWANEAFASYYAAEAAETLGLTPAVTALTPELEAARIPLNAWGSVGREEQVVEDYGYAASYELARLIGERAGPGLLRAVWEAATRGEAAYQPVDPTLPRERTAGGPPDWRGLLDLLEERTGVAFADLWATWVVRPSESSLLGDRAATRELYQATIRAAGDWNLSPVIRQAMDAWQFDQAELLLRRAREVLDERTTLEESARAAGLALPAAVRQRFEGPAGPDAALAELRSELVAVREIADSEGLLGRPIGAFQSFGLIGRDPDGDVEAARAAFAGGDLETAVARAQAARSAWLGADDAGRWRVLWALVALALLGGAGAFVFVSVVRRHRRPTAVGLAHADAGDRVGTDGRYATLAPQEAPDAAPRGTSDEAAAETGETASVTSQRVGVDRPGRDR